MTIDPDVRGIAAQWSNSATFARLLQAVVNAEGGGAHIIRAVQCSFPSVQTREQALAVLCRSVVHAMSDFIVANHHASDFVLALGAKWAPLGVANDPHNLNANWATNVYRFWSDDKV